MSPSADTRIGPYEIVGAIGAGGPPSLEAIASSASSYGEVSPKPRMRTQ